MSVGTVELYPAIDLRGGRCVRLTRGDYDAETVYDDDPAARARAFEAAGANWIHVVDLDAARTGEPANLEAIRAICGAVECRVETGGGVRSVAAAERLFDAGADRVVVGTAAVERPELVDELVARASGRVAVGLDARGDEVAVHGWTRSAGVAVTDLARRFDDAGVDALIVTQIDVDGTLEGPDVAGLAAVLDVCVTDVIASGGVGSLSDLRALAAVRAGGRALAGVIVGRALYEGRIDLEEALATCSQPG